MIEVHFFYDPNVLLGIVASVILYLLIGWLCTLFVSSEKEYDDGLRGAVFLFWPFALVFFVVVSVLSGLGRYFRF